MKITIDYATDERPSSHTAPEHLSVEAFKVASCLLYKLPLAAKNRIEIVKITFNGNNSDRFFAHFHVVMKPPPYDSIGRKIECTIRWEMGTNNDLILSLTGGFFVIRHLCPRIPIASVDTAAVAKGIAKAIELTLRQCSNSLKSGQEFLTEPISALSSLNW